MATKTSVGSLKEADLKGKRVFVRVDLNVPLDHNFNITDDTRIRAAVPTIKYLIGHGAKVVLSTHLVCRYISFHVLINDCCVIAAVEPNIYIDLSIDLLNKLFWRLMYLI